MRSFIQPIFKIVTAACLFSRPCSACTRFYKNFLLEADIKGQSFKRLRPNFCRTSKSKSSNAPITPKGLSFCRDAGLSSAPSRGSLAVAAGQGFRKSHPKRTRFSPPRLDSSHAQKALSELTNFSDRLLAWYLLT